MRLVSRVFVFASTLFIIIYGILPGIFLLRVSFIAAYVAGRNLLAGMNPIVFYRFPDLQKLIDRSGFSTKFVPPLVSTPSSLLIDSLLAIFPISVSRFLTGAINLAALILLAHISSSVAKSSVKTSYLVILSSSFALATNFSVSQPMIILALLFVLSFYASSTNAEGTAGVALGIIFPFSAFAAIPAVLFLLSKKWRTFLYFVLSGALIVLLTYLVEGRAALLYYLQKVFPYYLNGTIGNPFSTEYQTAWSFFRRIFVFNATLNPLPALVSERSYLLAVSLFKSTVIVPCAYFFFKGVTQKDYRESMIAAAFSVILMSPTGSVYQLIVLAPAVIALSQIAIDENKAKTARLFLILYALACIPVYNLLQSYFGVHNFFLIYEEFLLVILLFIVYLIFQLRKFPRHLLVARTAITGGVVLAVALTLFIGNRGTTGESNVPVEPTLGTRVTKAATFSPAWENGRLTFISVDPTNGHLTPRGNFTPEAAIGNCYGLASDQAGENFAFDMVRSGQPVVYFKTRYVSLSFEGEMGSVSRDGDLGSFQHDGKLYLIDLDPYSISVDDTLDFLPFRIIASCFDAGRDNHLNFVLDSLNSSYSLVRYDIGTQRSNVNQLYFRPPMICSENNDVYATKGIADSTEVVVIHNGTDEARLFALHGSVDDLAILNGDLYLSSDFERGMGLPTVYKYILRDASSPISSDK